MNPHNLGSSDFKSDASADSATLLNPAIIQHRAGVCALLLSQIHDVLMFHCENDLLANLIVLSPKIARKQFREGIFKDWEWCCAYCDKQLSSSEATIDHVVPKHKGGHSTRNNMVCSCAACNRNKGSQNVFEYMNPDHSHYSEQRVGKLKRWMEQKPCSMRFSVESTETLKYGNETATAWAT